MRPKSFRLLAFIWLLAGLLLTACQLDQSLTRFGPPSSRVLFIGNSFTFVNDGLDVELNGLDPSVETRRVAFGGYTLQMHWNDGQALQAIHGSQWNYVILQDQSQTPAMDRALFLEYAAKFDAEIRKAGAQTILLMTWQRPDSVAYGVTTANLADAYDAAGEQLGAKVAPAGIAFANALSQRPDISLNVNDGHPTPQGTYLAACVLYATLYGKSPIDNSYRPSGVTDDQAVFLQMVAAQVTGLAK